MSEEGNSIGETPHRDSPIISRPPPPIPPRRSVGSSQSILPSPIRSDDGPPFVKQFSLTKWKISFDGNTCVREFFSSLDECREADNLTDSYLVRRFHEVLSGIALQYYRSIRRPGLTFIEIRQAFLKTFGSADFEFRIGQEVRNLKQRPEQSVKEFVIRVTYLNAKLSKPIEEPELVDIVTHNMLPKYTPCLSIQKFPDLNSLIEAASHFESFLKTPKAVASLDSSVNPTSSSGQASQSPKPRLNKPHQSGSKVQSCPTCSQTQPHCLKCNNPGHSYRSCPVVTGMLCFKCRTPGFITRDCPKCNPKNA